jgi:hypothetical protein
VIADGFTEVFFLLAERGVEWEPAILAGFFVGFVNAQSDKV